MSGGDGELFDLAEYTREPEPNADYEARKERARSRQASQSASGRDIGAIPAVVDPARRERCRRDLRLFLETYFPAKFALEWSSDHLRVIDRIQRSVLGGGLFALAMPRGSGKTSICEGAALWAPLYAHRKFVMVIGAADDAAKGILDEIKAEIETNPRLLEDFPAVCVPVRRLEGITNRANGQICNGARTLISWTDSEIRLPTVEGSEASGHCICVAGITGHVRGRKVTLASGESARPDYVLVDDPQTDESAGSKKQNHDRVRILSGAVLGLAGPGVKIAGTMPCTVIKRGDMADEILDQTRHPEWQGERMRMLRTFPADMGLWDRYGEIRADSLRAHGDIRDATAFYEANRAAMDAGADVSWPARFEPGELSGLQNAMNLYYRDKESFFAEYQNEPMPDDAGPTERITAELVWSRMDGSPRGVVPDWADRVTAFADVQERVLYYAVMAFGPDFRGHVVDYGTWPGQARRYFTRRDAAPTYDDIHPGMAKDPSVREAVREVAALVFGTAWRKADGTAVPVEWMMADSGWGEHTAAVYEGAADFRAEEAARLGGKAADVPFWPSKGKGVKAGNKPISEYSRPVGVKKEDHRDEWMFHPVNGRSGRTRLMEFDANYWKSFVRERIATPKGRRSAFSLFGSDVERARLFAEHMSAESSVATSGRGRRLEEWTCLPGRENDWFDCIVGCYVGASKSKCALDAVENPATEAAARAATGRAEERPSAAQQTRPGGVKVVRFGGSF